MRMKKAILVLSIIAILTICMFNSVAAAPVSKQTPDVHSNYAVDMRGNQQTYLTAWLGGGDATTTIGIGQNTYLAGALSSGAPSTSLTDLLHGIANATVNIQSMNSNGGWTTVATRITDADSTSLDVQSLSFSISGEFSAKLTPAVAGVYTYRVTYDGDSQYAPAVSNVVTLTVTNVAIS